MLMKHGFYSALEVSGGGREMNDWPGSPQGPVEYHLCSSELFSETEWGTFGSCFSGIHVLP